MTQTQLFFTLLMTALLSISAVREFYRQNFAMGALLVAIPFCGWISIWVKS